MFPIETVDQSSDDDTTTLPRVKKRTQQLSDSDTDKENVKMNQVKRIQGSNEENGSDSDMESDKMISKRRLKKSRIRMEESNSDSDNSSSNQKEEKSVKNEEQQMRMKNKRDKMNQKFKGLLTSRGKQKIENNSDNDSSKSSPEGSAQSEGSDNEMSSIAKIKQKIKKSMACRPSICDPDTSDEESNMNKEQASRPKQKKPQKSAKIIEAKPMRMSAKQAMENMQLIKSESNRMLREKAVSLPYHRPKALSLKDIMARRKPAVASDGKALPIKMNEDQLKQYALLLEERQKEMMELCKSETDEEDTAENYDKSEENQTTDIQANENAITETDIEKVNNVNDASENGLEANNVTECVQTTNESLHKEIDGTILKDVNTEDIKNPDTVDITELNDSNFDEITDINKSVECNTEEQPENDSNTDLKLVYNSSIEEEHTIRENTENVDKIPTDKCDTKETEEISSEKPISEVNTEQESQLISLHYTEKDTDNSEKLNKPNLSNDGSNESPKNMDTSEQAQDDFFSDDDVNMDDIDKIIENAEIMKEDNDNINSPLLLRDPQPLKTNPKLMGAPGMVIDLDGTDPFGPKKSGVELLKERFTYFAKLKTPEELEKEKEKRLKPGGLHLKLKQELEEKIAEQRSLEWAKRLEEEKELHKEMDSILDDEDDADDSIEKIKSKLHKEDDNGDDNEGDESENEEEEELIEDDVVIKDKPKKHNPMVDDEAEESSCDENEQETELRDDNEVNDDVNEDDGPDDDDNDGDESSSDDTSSDSEEETAKPKKGRILKAFEDSDDETLPSKEDNLEQAVDCSKVIVGNNKEPDIIAKTSDIQVSSQDDEIQLAQQVKTGSEDLFTGQENSSAHGQEQLNTDEVIGTQTFSILESATTQVNTDIELGTQEKLSNSLFPSQPQAYHDPNLKSITDDLSQNMLDSQSQLSVSQPIGEDVLALCTGKFYDNEFISQVEENPVDTMSQESYISNVFADPEDNTELNENVNKSDTVEQTETADVETLTLELKQIAKDKPIVDNNLKSILDELDDPAFDEPKPNKFFTGGSKKKEENEGQMKKRFVIDSDDEQSEAAVEGKKKKKIKKRKAEKRALQISDDEEEEEELDDDNVMSDLEDDTEKLVEYDSEENEIEVLPQADNTKKKKRKMAEFFENEAELTSEDEWVGSGDEDEHGLDRMEREEGDDEVFHQGKLRKELGQIHMRDVLDQDKREVRLLQELLFEDGDLGGGHRQRKFRWKNAEGDDETGTNGDDITDTQEEEFESEEQWRKQRHEREVFLRKMQNEDEEEASFNTSINRTTIIKANLTSKSMSMVLQEANKTKEQAVDSPVAPEKKNTKDIPSPKKSFALFQQSFHGSILQRGRGALARLAALATPLAGDDDAPKIGSLAPHKRNFVFAALTPDEDAPKATKRKAEVNLGTPKLMKKMKIEDKKNNSKNSLLDHLKATKRKAEVNLGTPKLMKKMKIEDKKNNSKNSLLDHLKV